ncbi:MAG TPA: DUF664 domain-containing protein [Acidimicrobiales bacterium]|jgi:uncharacterized damage-inducible protein DinB|nr:DUF664 domain-containing protein [Acidimicrobiales bacterium]
MKTRKTNAVLVDAVGRIREVVHDVVNGLTADQLSFRPDDRANSIAWLVWHLSRIEDDHISEAAGVDQVWTAQGWFARFGVPFDAADTGYGHRPSDVDAVRVPTGGLLTGYHDAVHDQSVRYLERLDDDELERIIDDSWDPPVTVAVRLVSVIADGLQHAGQAAYVRGLLERRRSA